MRQDKLETLEDKIDIKAAKDSLKRNDFVDWEKAKNDILFSFQLYKTVKYRRGQRSPL